MGTIYLLNLKIKNMEYTWIDYECLELWNFYIHNLEMEIYRETAIYTTHT